MKQLDFGLAKDGKENYGSSPEGIVTDGWGRSVARHAVFVDSWGQ